MKKNKKQMVKDLKISIDGNNLNYRKFTTSEIGRGVGIVTPSKGKGSFKRKDKHTKKYV